MEADSPQFLHVPTLLEHSVPRPSRPWVWYFGAGLLLLLILSGLTHAQGGAVAKAVDVLIALLIGGFLVLATWFSSQLARNVAVEHGKIDGISELITLRRWQEAAVAVQDVLSQPMRSPGARVQTLIYFAGILGRYHRFEEAIEVYDYLLSEYSLDERSQQAMKLGRAMSFLRNDQLFDADRAISDLRRSARRNSVDDSEGAAPMPQFSESAGLALLEMYRDVKTGHPEEAIQVFQVSKDDIRRQFGHRVADAYALAAKAYDLLNRDEDARQAFADATALSPLDELTRRYPEVQSLAVKYTPTPSPYAQPTPPPVDLSRGVLA